MTELGIVVAQFYHDLAESMAERTRERLADVEARERVSG